MSTKSEQMIPSSQSEYEYNRGSSEDRGTKYERLRAWYLAHLRKSNLVGDIASGVTPATLIKRDREALEMLIADSEPVQPSHSGSNSFATRLARPYFKSVLLIGIVNGLGAFWLLSGFGSSVSNEWTPRFGLALLLVLSGIFLAILAKRFYRSEVTLQAVTQREQAIADYAYEAFWSVDADYNFVAINPAFERLLGTRNFRHLQKSLFSVVPADEHERLKQCLTTAKDSKQVQKVETQMLKDDGSVVDLELTAEYSISDATFYCVAVDISSRKEVERLKEQLMAMLSHDLKTPLSSLRFSLALLGSSTYGSLNEEGQNALKIGENNVTRLIDLINQLLDLHKLDAHQLKLTLKDVSVSEIIQPALEAIESYAEQKQIDVDISADEIYVRSDRERMVQVLINLLSNAIKYSPPGSKVVLAVKKLSGDWLAEFRVTDSGPGIAKEHRQLVFDRFYRVPQEDGNSEEGTGLGLAICKAIVEAHGGKIDVEGGPPGGASFYCHIPAVKNKSKELRTSV
jgi:PAS domain S-box-containing protein